MPKKQTTASKKARAAQREAGGKYTTLLAAQVCGKPLDPFESHDDTCSRPPHPGDEPCSPDRHFDGAAWKKRVTEERAAAQAQWAALSDEERAELERLAFEEEYDDGRTATDEWEDARAYKWMD